jgi:NAD(P)-dependent dehydrogenase (short-subunit alcohol dehydrogenase family)
MADWTEADVPSQRGRLAIVTGASSGIGRCTALGLARAGADVILASRSEAHARATLDQIGVQAPGARARFELLDLASLSSVRAFAARMRLLPKVELLVNNAGTFAPRRVLTEDRFERSLATNYLGPFALTLGLMPVLLRSPCPRVTTVSSLAANQGGRGIDLESLTGEGSYHARAAYGQSKLADLMFALELGRRAAAQGLPLISNACQPGLARTNLQSGGKGRPPWAGVRFLMHFVAQDAEHGALSTLRAATDPAATSGSYYGPDRELKGFPVLCEIPPPALDAMARTRLWELSERLTSTRWEFGSTCSSTPSRELEPATLSSRAQEEGSTRSSDESPIG